MSRVDGVAVEIDVENGAVFMTGGKVESVTSVYPALRCNIGSIGRLSVSPKTLPIRMSIKSSCPVMGSRSLMTQRGFSRGSRSNCRVVIRAEHSRKAGGGRLGSASTVVMKRCHE